MRIIVAAQKGEQTKTATTVNLAAALAETGRKGFVVDLDSQQHDAMKYAGSIEGVEFLTAMPNVVPQGYFVVVDTAPQIVTATGKAFLHSDLVLIPCTPLGPSLESLARTFETIDLARQQNPSLIAAVTFTRVDRSAYSAGVIAAARVLSMWGVTEACVPLRTMDFERAFAARRPVVLNAPKSAGAVAYRALGKEVERMVGK